MRNIFHFKKQMALLLIAVLCVAPGWAKRTSKNAQTESAYCANCLNPAVADRVSQASQNMEDIAKHGAGPSCYAQQIIAAAKNVVRQRFGNRTRGEGQCAKAVRMTLEQAKVSPGGKLGNGKDMVPSLTRMGFVNVIRGGMTPDSAPNGSILVYGGATVKGCSGLGAKFGHVEIKENDSSYFYDARASRNIQDAYPPKCRPLIGVMVMGSECKTCNRTVKNMCGA